MNKVEFNFSTPDAACHSLRVIAEKVRTGELKVVDHEVRGAGPLFDGSIYLRIVEPGKPRR